MKQQRRRSAVAAAATEQAASLHSRGVGFGAQPDLNDLLSSMHDDDDDEEEQEEQESSEDEPVSSSSGASSEHKHHGGGNNKNAKRKKQRVSTAQRARALSVKDSRIWNAFVLLRHPAHETQRRRRQQHTRQRSRGNSSSNSKNRRTDAAVATEVARQRSVRNLQQRMTKLIEQAAHANNASADAAARRLKQLDSQVYSKWQFSQQLRGAGGGSSSMALRDPLIPANVTRDAELAGELVRIGISAELACGVCDEMKKYAEKALASLASQASLMARSHATVRVAVLDDEGGRGKRAICGTTPIEFSLKKIKMRLNLQHYRKLVILHDAQSATRLSSAVADGQLLFTNLDEADRGNQDEDSDNAENVQLARLLRSPRYLDSKQQFHNEVFVLLLRYASLQGQFTEAAGMQAAANGECFDVLLRHFDCAFECFASPLNCRYARYCSAFADTDARFGSCGSFFDFTPPKRGGCCEATPPFVPAVIHVMNERMHALLTQADTTATPLMFVVIIPTWRKTASWQMVYSNRFKRHHFSIAQDEHGYTEGAQFMRATRFRVSTCDTSVFFLQSAAARDKWPVTKQICNELRAAFKSKHTAETESRRLFIHGIPPSVTEDAMQAALELKWAPIRLKDVYFPRSVESKKARGFGFVTFQSVSDCARVAAQCGLDDNDNDASDDSDAVDGKSAAPRQVPININGSICKIQHGQAKSAAAPSAGSKRKRPSSKAADDADSDVQAPASKRRKKKKKKQKKANKKNKKKSSKKQ
jgi:hypothetical protein